MAAEHKGSKKDIIDCAIESGAAQARIPSKYTHRIYEGPAVFYCRSKYVDELYNYFGPPDGPVTKDSDCKITYAVSGAVVTSETLFWLCSTPDFGIQIVGPEPFVEAVTDYFQSLHGNLFKNYSMRKTADTV